jgi:hypothetical protein
VNNRGEAYTENLVGQRGAAPPRSDFSLVNGKKADGDSVNILEANTEESLVDTMVEISWHCREIRQITEKTNIDLRCRQGEIPEDLSWSKRLACKKRSVENLGGPIGSRERGKVCGY